MKKKYQEQYCKKHNQHYASYLNKCPICAGIEIGKMEEKVTEKINKKLNSIRG